MPKIGMRIVKSAVAVFLCLSLYILFGHQGVPFYAAIAAILCMQPDVSNSKRVAVNRMVGTLIGGVYGILVLTLLKTFPPPELLQYLIISACLIPLMYITVVLKKNTATYITCVVFLSITVSHSDALVPYAFGISRIVETLVGIFISLLINNFHIPRKRNTQALFISDLNGTLLNSERQLSSYTRIKLNHLLERGARITVATSRTPATLVNILKGVNLKLPAIVMNGAALYNLKDNTYQDIQYIDSAAVQQVLDLFAQQQTNCLTFTAFDDILHIYHGNFTNEAERHYFQDRKNLPLKSFIHGRPPKEQPIFYFTVFDRKERVAALRELLTQLDCAELIRTAIYRDVQHEGFYVLNVFSRDASKGAAAQDLLRQTGANALVVFGDDDNDLSLMEQTPHSYAVENATESVKEAASHIIDTNDSNSVVRTMAKLFYGKQTF